MQAILTKYHGPTDTRGQRISAQCDAGRISIPYPHEFSGEDVHRAAALALVKKLGWDSEGYSQLAGGQLPTGDYVFTFIPREYVKAKAAVIETRLAMSRGDTNGNPHIKTWGQMVDDLCDKNTDESPFWNEYQTAKAAK